MMIRVGSIRVGTVAVVVAAASPTTLMGHRTVPSAVIAEGGSIAVTAVVTGTRGGGGGGGGGGVAGATHTPKRQAAPPWNRGWLRRPSTASAYAGLPWKSTTTAAVIKIVASTTRTTNRSATIPATASRTATVRCMSSSSASSAAAVSSLPFVPAQLLAPISDTFQHQVNDSSASMASDAISSFSPSSPSVSGVSLSPFPPLPIEPATALNGSSRDDGRTLIAKQSGAIVQTTSSINSRIRRRQPSDAIRLAWRTLRARADRFRATTTPPPAAVATDTSTSTSASSSSASLPFSSSVSSSFSVKPAPSLEWVRDGYHELLTALHRIDVTAATTMINQAAAERAAATRHQLRCDLFAAYEDDVAPLVPLLQDFEHMLFYHGKQKRLNDALTLFDHLRTATPYIPSQRCYTNLLRIVTTLPNQHHSALSILEQMESHGHPVDHHVYNLFIGMHARAGDIDGAWQIVALMRQAGLQPDDICYALLIQGYGRARDSAGIIRVMNEMLNSYSSPSSSVSSSSIPFSSATSSLTPSTQVYNHILSAFCRAGHVSTAMAIFNEMKQMAGQSRGGEKIEFDLQRSTGRNNNDHNDHSSSSSFSSSATTQTAVRPNVITYTILIQALAGGFQGGGTDYTSSPSASSSSDPAIRAAPNLSAAFALFDEMVTQRGLAPSMATLNVLLAACAGPSRLGSNKTKNQNMITNYVTSPPVHQHQHQHQHHQFVPPDMSLAWSLFEHLRARFGLEPTHSTYSTMLAGLDVDAIAIWRQRSIMKQQHQQAMLSPSNDENDDLAAAADAIAVVNNAALMPLAVHLYADALHQRRIHVEEESTTHPTTHGSNNSNHVFFGLVPRSYSRGVLFEWHNYYKQMRPPPVPPMWRIRPTASSSAVTSPPPATPATADKPATAPSVVIPWPSSGSDGWTTHGPLSQSAYGIDLRCCSNAGAMKAALLYHLVYEPHLQLWYRRRQLRWWALRHEQQQLPPQHQAESVVDSSAPSSSSSSSSSEYAAFVTDLLFCPDRSHIPAKLARNAPPPDHLANIELTTPLPSIPFAAPARPAYIELIVGNRPWMLATFQSVIDEWGLTSPEMLLDQAPLAEAARMARTRRTAASAEAGERQQEQRHSKTSPSTAPAITPPATSLATATTNMRLVVPAVLSRLSMLYFGGGPVGFVTRKEAEARAHTYWTVAAQWQHYVQQLHERQELVQSQK